MKKQNIEVKRGCDFFGEGGESLGIIKRTLRAEQIGNFNPIFCTYKGKRTLVKSKAGDISDPFRRHESYLSSLFIVVD
jgi:hypothetical protein